MYWILFILLFASLTAADRFPVQIVNQTQIADDSEIYIIIKGLDTATGASCFVSIAPDGTAACQPVTGSTESTDFSYKLSDLKKGINLPYIESGRIYISIGAPLHFLIDEKNRLIVDPDGFKPRDPNYYTLYDKVEFSYVPNKGTWMNPTAVDFFSLPLRIEQAGSEIFKATGISTARSDFTNQVDSILKTDDFTPTHEWEKVVLHYTSRDGQKTLLRIMSPGKAMIPGVPGTNPMNQNYLNDKAKFGFSYIDALWNYYRTNTIIIDCNEIGAGFYTGQVVGDDFIFTKTTDPLNKVVISKPSNSVPWFAGAQGVFDAPNNTPKAIIVRQITSGFDVGLLPAENGIVMNRAFFDQKRNDGKYYTYNPRLADNNTGPWYDLYSKALHSFGQEQPIYTFAYDDALGQDGTLHDPNARNVSKAVITIGDMTGTPIPRPFQDDTVYSVTVSIGERSKVLYEGRELKTGDTLSNIKVPLQVTLNGQEAKIYFNPAIVLPQFQAADGIVVELQGNSSVNLIFPGLPKD